MEALSEKLSELPAISATAAMGACTDVWESLASQLCARCRVSAGSDAHVSGGDTQGGNRRGGEYGDASAL